jgi:hypothetical protein
MYPILALLLLTSLSCHSSALSGGRVAAGQEAQNVNFKVPPDSFKGVDFKNFSYPYQFSSGKKREVTLKGGEYEYEFADDRGWFSLSDVYFVDLTGDASPEAIASLSHVSCGGSCDGGAELFYVYTVRQNKVTLLWEFETGSLGYGCGLKSFSTRNQEITVELFSRCGGEEQEGGAPVSKFQTKDLTRMTFKFDGRKIVEVKKEYVSSPERSVQNYQPEISIKD